MRQYPRLALPEDWDSIEEFFDWYMKNGKPMLVPWDASVTRTDDATAICIFRHKRFQVEMYIIHPGYVIPTHGHPGMEVITMSLGGGNTGELNSKYGTSKHNGQTSKVVNGDMHGGQLTAEKNGFAILSFEHWTGNQQMSTAALQWTGPTAGPIHDELINTRIPGAAAAGQFDINAVAGENHV